MATLLKCLLLVSIISNTMSSEHHASNNIMHRDEKLLSFATVELGGIGTKQAEPLTHHKTIQCIDENINIRDPKNYEVEQHKKNEETKMSIVRQKRRTGCTMKTIITDDDDAGPQNPRNFNAKTSYDVTETLTSTPIVRNFNAHRSSSSDGETSSHELTDGHSYPTAERLPTIPHIGHEDTYAKSKGPLDPHDPTSNGRDTDFGPDSEPGPGEKTVRFQTNTHRHEIVDQTGFVREKTNGYPHWKNDDWKAKFKDIPYLYDDKGRLINSAASFSLFDHRHLFHAVLIQWILLIIA